MSLEAKPSTGPADASADDGQAIVHLVPHTHWDREWYEPFQVFRMRLVDLVDQLLERMAADPRLRFTLDGQAATVDDYLEIRPAAEPLIRRLIAERRLAIGPWQILLDEFLVSGETIVRNLELGWRRAEDLGGAMRVGYLPDMFGHVAQMPQLLRRAGIERAVVWRGVPSVIDRHTFTWLSPDGSWVETEYLVGGYGNGAYLFDVPSLLAPRLVGYRVDQASFYGERSLLAMYGTDHAVPTPELADLVERVNAAHGPVQVALETLSDYLERDGPHPADDPTRTAWSGELRSGARANMLMNVTSARVDLKHAAARAERRLERYAEPLAALHGDPDAWPERLLELAWRRLVDNSAHDSICGCSHDQVVAQVIGRYAEAHQIASGIVTRVLDRLARQAPAGGWVIVNPSPVDRADLVELDVAIPEAWGSVALRLGGRALPTQEVGRPDTRIAAHRVRGDEVVEFFHRRRHGRELFGRQINGLTIEGDGDLPRIRVRADDRPDPPELDVEGLMAEVGAAAARRPETIWAIDVRASERRRLLARIPVPALSAVRVGESDGSAAALEPIDHPVVATDRGLDNGLFAGPGRRGRLAPARRRRRRARRGRPHRRRWGGGRQLQLRAAAGRCPRRAPARRGGRGPGCRAASRRDRRDEDLRLAPRPGGRRPGSRRVHGPDHGPPAPRDPSRRAVRACPDRVRQPGARSPRAVPCPAAGSASRAPRPRGSSRSSTGA